MGRGQRTWPSLSEGSEPGDLGWNTHEDCEEGKGYREPWAGTLMKTVRKERGTGSPGTLGIKFWTPTLRAEKSVL